jgi:hypothetical protein
VLAAECRLVHRLDRETSGVLVVARTAAAAAWLSAAFARRAAAAGSGSSSSGGGGGGGIGGGSGGIVRSAAATAADAGTHPMVQRVYWAIVECGSDSVVQSTGIIEESLEVPVELQWLAICCCGVAEQRVAGHSCLWNLT